MALLTYWPEYWKKVVPLQKADYHGIRAMENGSRL